MLFENREQMKEFAKVLAKKMLERRSLSEWRKIAERATRVFSGKSYYLGMMRASPLPLGTYTKALNKMHFAVNGIRPYPEGGHQSNSRGFTRSNSRGHNPDGRTCVDTHQYDPVKCKNRGEYAPTTPEVIPDCRPVFTCTRPGGFVCNEEGRGFLCDQKFMGCNPPSNFACPEGAPGAHNCAHMFAIGDHCDNPALHACRNEDQFDCPRNFHCRESSGYSFQCATVPGRGAVFNCKDTFDCDLKYGCSPGDYHSCHVDFNCTDIFDCSGDFNCNLHDCGTSGDSDYDKFTCLQFTCPSIHNCEDAFECTPGLQQERFACQPSPETFSCGAHRGSGDNVNGFSCRDSSEGGFDCGGQFYCEGIYTCVNTFTCASYDCNTGQQGTGVGFECRSQPGVEGFQCSGGYQCDDGLDFKCTEAPSGTTFNCGEFECSVAHVFRCEGSFACDTHTCSAGANCNGEVACSKQNQFGGEGGPGVFSCDNGFSGCSQSVDCSSARVGFKCINTSEYDCNGVAYQCPAKYDSCVKSSEYNEFGNCDEGPQDHGCPNLDKFDCLATDKGGPYSCPATYQMLCSSDEHYEFNRSEDP